AVLAALSGAKSQIEVHCDAEFRAIPDKPASSDHVQHVANGTTITMSTTQVGGVARRVKLDRTLLEVVRAAAESFPIDALVKAVCPSPDGTLEPIPSLL